MKKLIVVLSLVPSFALAQGVAAMPPEPPMPPMPPPPPGMEPPGMISMGMPPGIPPHVAQRLGIAPETVKKVRDMGFDANEQLIGAEADLKRARLDLERYLAGSAVDEASALSKLETVSRAELQVKKNRLGLMIRIRKLLGPELWSKLEAEMPMPGPEGHGPGGQRSVRRQCDDKGCNTTTCANGSCVTESSTR
jgi:hypothetical protein